LHRIGYLQPFEKTSTGPIRRQSAREKAGALGLCEVEEVAPQLAGLLAGLNGVHFAQSLAEFVQTAALAMLLE
jgi:hypothetical protein